MICKKLCEFNSCILNLLSENMNSDELKNRVKKEAHPKFKEIRKQLENCNDKGIRILLSYLDNMLVTPTRRELASIAMLINSFIEVLSDKKSNASPDKASDQKCMEYARSLLHNAEEFSSESYAQKVRDWYLDNTEHSMTDKEASEVAKQFILLLIEQKIIKQLGENRFAYIKKS